MKKLFKRPVWLLTICMAVVVVFSVLANLVNTSAYNVKVETITFNTSGVLNEGEPDEYKYEGTMEGLLYMPKTCSEENPCPLIITTHGYLNSKEMQDAPSIELSKRGYIVLALDMYDHGGSTWNAPDDFAFYLNSLWDAVKEMYSKKYVLRDDYGNTMIAVSGHSMGGFSTEMAVMYDTMAMLYGGQDHRKIAVSLSVGADYRYSSESIIGLFGNRSSGMVIGHFDEFFGDDSCVGLFCEPNSVTYKDYIKTEEGQAFLGGGTNIEEGEEYQTNTLYKYQGGQRIIFTPYEIHPWNHFSTETTKNMIDFYDAAFEYQLAEASLSDKFTPTEVSGQTWWLKEAFEFVAMIALFAAIIPAFCLLLKVPFFAKVITNEETLPVEKETSKGKKIGLFVVALVTALLPAYFFPQLITGSSKNLVTFVTIAEAIISVCLLVTLGAWIFFFARKMIRTGEDDTEAKKVASNVTFGAVIVSAAALFLRFLSTDANKILNMGYYYNSPTSNNIGFWALASAAIALVTLTIVHFVARKRDGATIKSYGLAANLKQIGIALLISLILFVGVYVVVFLIGWLLNVDFRIWVYAVKSFDTHHFVTFLRYVPIFFIYYFINSIVIAANTKNIKGWKGYLYAVALNILGLVLFLVYHYGKLFITGTAAYPTLALQGILLFGLVPSLALAAVFAKKFAEKTNNVWTSAFFNTLLFTMITIANTAVILLAM